MESWRTAVATSDATHIWLRGYDLTELMTRAGFADTVFLLHQGRLPNPGERRLLEAMLVAVSDHGPGAPSCAAARLAASGNRQSISAAIAAGILAIGDEHGGAGSLCMELIASGVALAVKEGISIGDAARRLADEACAAQKRLPGMGHRSHTADPRTGVLFAMAREAGVAGNGVDFIEALESSLRDAGKPLPVNIDGALAGILYDLGFPPAFAKMVFIIGRVAGLTAEVAEEYAREKPMRIRIPVTYDGTPPRQIE